MNNFHRRTLLQTTPHGGASPSRDHNNGYGKVANFDSNMVIILAALLCALICALGMNSVVRCVLRCTRRTSTNEAVEDVLPRFRGRGLRKAALRQIPVEVYGIGVGLTDQCAICLDEFLDGEKIRVLPKCHHCFHVKCVDVWLEAHSSCPTCRQSLEAEEGDRDVAVEVVGRDGGDQASGGGAAEEVG